MRITIVQGAFMPVPPIFGTSVEKIWFALGQEFVRRGHQVTHISRHVPRLEPEEVVEGVHHIRVPSHDASRSLVRLKWRDLLYSRRALRVLPDADILVTNTFWFPILAPAEQKGRLYVHIARYPKGQMRFYHKAARLQTVSTVIRNAICREVPQLAHRVKVIPNFVSQQALAPVAHQRDRCILYVGRLHPEKGVDLLIEAFARLLAKGFRDWRLRLVGPWEEAQGGGGGEYFRGLRNKSRGIEQFVEWIGPVFDAERLKSYYQQSSFFVYPSLAGRGEAFPLAPLEAMAEGCPPVVSSLECFRDYIRSESNGWTFDAQSGQKVESLVATLEQVLRNEQMIREVRDNALRTAEQFTLPKIADRYLNDFQELMNQ